MTFFCLDFNDIGATNGTRPDIHCLLYAAGFFLIIKTMILKKDKSKCHLSELIELGLRAGLCNLPSILLQFMAVSKRMFKYAKFKYS